MPLKILPTDSLSSNRICRSKFRLTLTCDSSLHTQIGLACSNPSNRRQKKQKQKTSATVKTITVKRWEGKSLEAIQVSPLLLCCSFPATTNVYTFLLLYPSQLFRFRLPN
ncbi:hypothetical protein ACB094_08G075700 [Castanea mollissima]